MREASYVYLIEEEYEYNIFAINPLRNFYVLCFTVCKWLRRRNASPGYHSAIDCSVANPNPHLNFIPDTDGDTNADIGAPGWKSYFNRHDAKDSGTLQSSTLT
jgi:hypothetical protein